MSICRPPNGRAPPFIQAPLNCAEAARAPRALNKNDFAAGASLIRISRLSRRRRRRRPSFAIRCRSLSLVVRRRRSVVVVVVAVVRRSWVVGRSVVVVVVLVVLVVAVAVLVLVIARVLTVYIVRPFPIDSGRSIADDQRRRRRRPLAKTNDP